MAAIPKLRRALKNYFKNNVALINKARRYLQACSHLLKKSLKGNVQFCSMENVTVKNIITNIVVVLPGNVNLVATNVGNEDIKQK